MIDLHGAEPVWRVPAERMKMALERKGDEQNDFVVPLAPQAVEVIEAVRPLTGRGPLLFPNDRHAHKPMSENALGYALNRAGYHKRHVPHGWRATFSTVMNELASAEGRPGDRAIIDMMLAHAPKDKVESAYNRAAHMARRRELALMWANMLMVGMPPAAELLGSKRR